MEIQYHRGRFVMIVPFTQKYTYEGDIEVKFRHLPTSKKDIYDRLEKCWESKYVIDPVTKEVIKAECSCPDFQINKMGESDCKHILESKYLLNSILGNYPKIKTN